MLRRRLGPSPRGVPGQLVRSSEQSSATGYLAGRPRGLVTVGETTVGPLGRPEMSVNTGRALRSLQPVYSRAPRAFLGAGTLCFVYLNT